MRGSLLPLLLAVTPAAAQDVPPAPPADPYEALLAFTTLDTRMTVPVQIAGAGPYRFIIDTGAQRTVISRELAGKLGLARGRDVRLTAMTGTTVEGTVVIPAITVSTLGATRVEAPALAGTNLGALGMLGIDTLQGHAVSIDFDRQVMAVRPSSRRTRNQDALPNEIVVRAKNLYGQLVVTDAWCNGVRVRVILDTGSAASLGNPALQRRLVRRHETLTPVRFTSVTGESFTAQSTQIAQVKVGDLTISGLPIAYADAAPFRQFGLQDTPAIMLGMDALQMFRRVRIDFANRELRLALPRDARMAGTLTAAPGSGRTG